MGRPLNARTAPAQDVRAAIAGRWLGARTDEVLGRVVLRPHQTSAAGRLRAIMDGARGAMLADPVGLGKTYTALAAARGASRLVVVAPAALRGMWHDACAAAGIAARVVSYHALSRGRAPGEADFVIVDEAHHVRNPATRRYRALAALTARAPALLLTATPIHNRPDDLRAQLALFLGAHAWSAPEPELARFVVKRDAEAVGSARRPTLLPRAAAVCWLDVGDDSPLLEGIARMPPPLPARNAGGAGALVALSLVRQWASSRAALAAALRRRLALAAGLTEALRAGRHPTRAELRAWIYADGALQLAFPELVSQGQIAAAGALLDQAERHAAHSAMLLGATASNPDPDDVRAEWLGRVRAEHPGARVIVFAEFAETVRALYARTRHAGAVAMLTDRGAVVAGGRLTRPALLAQFAPGGAESLPAAERVSLLITTDLLSEGVNLQEASVIVHADLPWSPARFEQRVGRVRRLQSRHAEVFVYALRPPAPAERLLRMEARLRAKLAGAARTVGVRGTILPRLFPAAADPPTPPPAVQADARIAQALAAWPATAGAIGSGILVGAVRSPRGGFLALVEREGRAELVAALDGHVSDAPDAVLEALAMADGPDAPIDAPGAERAVARLRGWLESRASSAVLELTAGGVARMRRRVLRRIDVITTRSPRHLRSRFVPLARDARRVATATFAAGAERVLEELADASMPDEAWLRAVGTFAGLHAPAAVESGVVAMLLLVTQRPG